MPNNTVKLLQNGEYDKCFQKIYACEASRADYYRDRFLNAIKGYNKYFGESENFRLFSAPGRTEIGGNHTDHQHGHVLCGSVNLDVIAVVVPNTSDKICIKSEGYEMDTITINDIDVYSEEYNKAIALIRGITAYFVKMGYKIGGFNAYTTSNVLKGSGLSSSAAFEVLIGNILNSLYANNEIDPVEIAKIGQYAENVYFNKPCGLMDQMASSVGGVVSIDFKDTKNPVIEKIDFSHENYALCIIDSGADHADLTDEYGAITTEMKSVAKYFNKEFLRDVDEDAFYKDIKNIREMVGDRAIVRAIHYFNDDKRVAKQVLAIKENDFDRFKELITESGYSSFMYLQNVYASSYPQSQAVSIVLALCEKLLKGKGAYRVHGGGFAGTIQAFVPIEMLLEFKSQMEALLGDSMCHVLNIRPVGGCEIIL